MIATVSTVVVVGALATAIVTSKGWPNVRATFFSWSSLKDSFPDLLKGFWLDVRIFLIVELIVLVLGLAIAVARSSRPPALAPLRLLGTLFVDVLRGVPTILVIYLIGFGVPALELSHVPSDPVILGGAALALSYSALRCIDLLEDIDDGDVLLDGSAPRRSASCAACSTPGGCRAQQRPNAARNRA